MEILAQSVIDVMAWFLQPFAYVLILGWVISFFKKD